MNIPKKIHYCWFGGKNFPPLVEKCMESWHRNLPDWEIVRWDESNAPLSNVYVKRAIELKQYAFAADYVRFYALHEYGGVYLDTDVEIVKDLSPLCSLKAFAAPENIEDNLINVAVFGAEKGHLLTKAVMDYYDQYIGDFDIIPRIFTKIISESIYDISILPRESFYPYNPYDPQQTVKQLFSSDITIDTYAIHHWLKSWDIPKKKLTFSEKMANSIRKRNPFK